MSTYLEKLRAKKRQKGQPGEVQKQQKAKAPQQRPVGRGAITAKNPSCTFCSTPTRPFPKIEPLPGWCRADCQHLRRMEQHKAPALLACHQWRSPTSWTWARLDRMDGCPLTTRAAPSSITDPKVPAFCRVDCLNYQVVTAADLPPVAICWQTKDNELWRPFRLDKMQRCPLPKKKPPTTGPEVPGLPCGGCGSTRYRRVENGFVYPDGSRTDGWHCGGADCGVKLLTGRIKP